MEKVGRAGSPDFVAPEKRIAAFDNDGTLWIEQPMYVQLVFLLDRVKALAPEHPEWKEKQPFKAALARDLKVLGQFGARGLAELTAATSSRMTTEEFEKIVSEWIRTALKEDWKTVFAEPSDGG